MRICMMRVCVCECGDVSVTVCMWRPEDDIIKLLFSSHLSVGSGLTSGCQTCTANVLAH